MPFDPPLNISSVCFLKTRTFLPRDRLTVMERESHVDVALLRFHRWKSSFTSSLTFIQSRRKSWLRHRMRLCPSTLQVGDGSSVSVLRDTDSFEE